MRNVIKKGMIVTLLFYTRVTLLAVLAVLTFWGLLNAFAFANNMLHGNGKYFPMIPYFSFSSVGEPALKLLEKVWPMMGVIFIISLGLSFLLGYIMEKYQSQTQKEIRNDR